MTELGKIEQSEKSEPNRKKSSLDNARELSALAEKKFPSRMLDRSQSADEPKSPRIKAMPRNARSLEIDKNQLDELKLEVAFKFWNDWAGRHPSGDSVFSELSEDFDKIDRSEFIYSARNLEEILNKRNNRKKLLKKVCRRNRRRMERWKHMKIEPNDEYDLEPIIHGFIKKDDRPQPPFPFQDLPEWGTKYEDNGSLRAVRDWIIQSVLMKSSASLNARDSRENDERLRKLEEQLDAIDEDDIYDRAIQELIEKGAFLMEEEEKEAEPIPEKTSFFDGYIALKSRTDDLFYIQHKLLCFYEFEHFHLLINKFNHELLVKVVEAKGNEVLEDPFADIEWITDEDKELLKEFDPDLFMQLVKKLKSNVEHGYRPDILYTKSSIRSELSETSAAQPVGQTITSIIEKLEIDDDHRNSGFERLLYYEDSDFDEDECEPLDPENDPLALGQAIPKPHLVEILREKMFHDFEYQYNSDIKFPVHWPVPDEFIDSDEPFLQYWKYRCGFKMFPPWFRFLPRLLKPVQGIPMETSKLEEAEKSEESKKSTLVPPRFDKLRSYRESSLKEPVDPPPFPISNAFEHKSGTNSGMNTNKFKKLTSILKKPSNANNIPPPNFIHVNPALIEIYRSMKQARPYRNLDQTIIHNEYRNPSPNIELDENGNVVLSFDCCSYALYTFCRFLLYSYAKIKQTSKFALRGNYTPTKPFDIDDRCDISRITKSDLARNHPQKIKMPLFQKTIVDSPYNSQSSASDYDSDETYSDSEPDELVEKTTERKSELMVLDDLVLDCPTGAPEQTLHERFNMFKDLLYLIEFFKRFDVFSRH